MLVNQPRVMYAMSSTNFVNLKIVIFNCHSFLALQHIVTSNLNYCGILMLQETLLSDDDSFKLGKLIMILIIIIVWQQQEKIIIFVKDIAAGWQFYGVRLYDL